MRTISKIARFITVILLLLFISSNPGYPAYASDGAEVFDIQKSEIVRTIAHSANLQQEAEKWLEASAEPVGSMLIEPPSGIGIKIELAPPVKIKREWLTGTVTQVVLFVSPSKTYSPKLLIFTKENRMIAVTLRYDLKPFLQANGLYDRRYNLSAPAPR